MEMFDFNHTVPAEEQHGSLSYYIDKPKRVLKLRECLRKLKVYIRHEDNKLRSQMTNARREDEELKETLKDLREELDDVNEEHDDLKAKVANGKENLFWKSIHKKHVREDLTDLKVRYLAGCCLQL